MDLLLKDLRLGVRRLRRDLLLTITATVSLAIGIGANTALYTMARGLLFQPQPGLANPGELVDIGRTSDGYGFNSISYPDYMALREQTTSLRDVYASNMFPQAVSVTVAGGRPDRLFATFVSRNYFTALGVVPGAGRTLQRADGDGVSASPVMVIGDALWARLFNRDRAAVGSVLNVNGQSITIVGVAPPGFHGTGIRSAEAWLPIGALDAANAARLLARSDAAWLLVGGRRRSGASVARVNAELQILARSLPSSVRDATHGLRAVTASPIPGVAGPVGIFIALLSAVVAIVLAVACANLSGMLLSRIPLRQREMAVRAAVGASRARLVRQLLAETMMLFAFGAAAGLFVAGMLTRAVPVMLSALPFPLALTLTLDGRTILFTSALAFVAAIASGLMPAVQASRLDLGAAMNADRHQARGTRLRRIFVVAQVALSVVLVVVGGLFIRATLHAGAWAPGFDARGVELVTLKFSDDNRRATAADTLTLNGVIERVKGIPGVERISAASSFPGGFEEMRLGGLRVPATGRLVDDGEWNVVTPGYFQTIRMAMRAGRDFTSSDRAGAPRVAIIGEGAARRLWPEHQVAAVIGEVLEQIGLSTDGRTLEATPITIVGVSADPAYGTLIDGRNDVHIYLPAAQVPLSQTMLVVRTADGRSVATDIRAAIAAATANVTIDSTRSAEEYSLLGLLPQRVGALLTAALGTVGLLLAAIGVYGVTASVIAQRRREIGIRMALGAPAAAITRLVLREGMSLVLIGALLGLPFALASGRLLSGYLAGLPATDPVTWCAAVASFGMMGLLACSAPLARALRISPADTLHERS